MWERAARRRRTSSQQEEQGKVNETHVLALKWPHVVGCCWRSWKFDVVG